MKYSKFNDGRFRAKGHTVGENGKTKPHGAVRFNVEQIVRERYAEGARKKQKTLCCPVTYDPQYLKVIPKEILDKDYGCGDPTAYLQRGDVVLDLGSGAGKVCFIASQIVGPRGKVIGIDFNPDMLKLARQYQKEVARRIGWSNAEFKRARIQDLKTDLERLERKLAQKPIQSLDDWIDFQRKHRANQKDRPLIEDESIDVIVSNCVLNLVRPDEKEELFSEMYRVLKKGGRVAISDIVSDEEVPEALRHDPDLWSGCIAGAFQEKAFVQAFEKAGFYGITIVKRDEEPWRVIQGIEFRSITMTAFKGKEGLCWERNQAVIYKGPWRQVEDDDHHILRRGVRIAVCDKTFQIFSKAPYQADLILVEPRRSVPLSRAKSFDCSRDLERDPRETKGLRYKKTLKVQSVCMEGGCCS